MNIDDKWYKMKLRKNEFTKSSSLRLTKIQRKPDWLKVKLPTGDAYKKVKTITKSYSLHTICESFNCQNM